MLHLDKINYCRVQIKLIEIQFFSLKEDKSSRFMVTIYHQLNNFQTSSFSPIDQKIDLNGIYPIVIQHPIRAIHQQNYKPFLKIVIGGYQSRRKYETVIDQNVLLSLYEQNQKHEGKMKRKMKHLLSFPLFGQERKQNAQIKLQILIIKKDLHLSNKFSQQGEIKCKRKNQRKIVFSKIEEDYFCPYVSQPIKIKIDSDDPDKQQEIKNNNQKIYKGENNLDEKHQIPDHFQLFKEQQISAIELRDSNQGKSMTEQQLGEIQSLQQHAIFHAFRNKEQENKQIQILNNVPDDYRHLFQKISEINKKYAPLQRIPSQEQLSQCSSIPNNLYHPQNNSLIQSNLSDSIQINKHLLQSEELLKELNLYKFALAVQQQQQNQCGRPVISGESQIQK